MSETSLEWRAVHAKVVLDVYIKARFDMLTSDSENFQPKSWWSLGVMKSLFICHLEYMKACGSEKA